MKNQKRALAATILLGAAGLSFLAGCKLPFGGDSSHKDTIEQDFSSMVNDGDVLLRIDGKPVLTVQEYEKQLDMARQVNQQIDMLLQMMPNAEKDYIFKGIATTKLMKAWAENKGLDKDPEFKEQRKQLHEAADLQLYAKAFDDAHPVHVSDAEVKSFYEEQKDQIPGLMTNPGGVSAVYVRFDTKDKAENFLEKVKDVKGAKAFKEEAKKEKLKVADATINEKSSFGDAIKNAVLGVQKFPSVQVVKAGDDAYWVICAISKSKAEYRDVKSKEVHEGLKKMLVEQKKEKQLDSLMDQLKKDLNVVENSDYFNKKEETKRAAMEELAKQYAAQQSQNNDTEADSQNKPAVEKV